MFKKRLLRRQFGPKRDEVMGEWRKLHSGELRKLYSSPDIIRQIKSRRMRRVGYVTHMGGDRKAYKVLVGKPKEGDHLKDQGIDCRMGLKCIIGRLAGGEGGVESIYLTQDRDW
jgi:hypothetical protein